MHYGNLVIIEPPDADEPLTEAFVRDAVESAMGPHEEQGGFWDWYQIGGRWTGALDGYDPDTDPANQAPCDFCEQGITTAAVAERYPAYREHVGKPCIQCKGTGHITVWPTDWAFRAGDVQPIAQLTAEQYEKFYRVVVDGRHWERELYEPWQPKLEDRFRRIDLPPLEWLKGEYADRLIVVVDNHQ